VDGMSLTENLNARISSNFLGPVGVQIFTAIVAGQGR
jgi:hypothetical protein